MHSKLKKVKNFCKHIYRWLVALAVFGLLWAHDVFYVNAQFLSLALFFLWPMYGCWWLYQRKKRDLSFGGLVFSLVFVLGLLRTVEYAGNLHDEWVVAHVRQWGDDLKARYSNHECPKNLKQRFHGNFAYYSCGLSDGTRGIFFDRFNYARQFLDIDSQALGDIKER